MSTEGMRAVASLKKQGKQVSAQTVREQVLKDRADHRAFMRSLWSTGRRS